jgi:hypothetical protein
LLPLALKHSLGFQLFSRDVKPPALEAFCDLAAGLGAF